MTPGFRGGVVRERQNNFFKLVHYTVVSNSAVQGLNWGDPTGYQIRYLLFEIHYL